jgi:HEAT repeat protein
VPVRASSWQAAVEHADWFDVASARYALRDESANVRAAAVAAWRNHGGALPRAELQRLAGDESTAVRITLVHLLETNPDHDATSALQRDPNAYVRGIARTQLGSA